MTVVDVATAGGVIVASGLSFVVLWPAARRTGLGLVHPAILWLAVEIAFFGIGSVALAVADGRPGPAAYVGACLIAAAIGTLAADRWLAPRVPAAPPARPLAATDGARRWVPLVLAFGSLAILAPTFARVGLPLLTPDATGGRVELSGMTVQLLRVSAPALALVIVLRLVDGGTYTGRRGLDVGIVALAVALTIALASRYLVLELIASLVIAWVLAGRPLPVRFIVIGGLVAAVGFVAIGLVRAPSEIGPDPVSSTVERMISRLFLVQPRTLAALQEVIPSETPYFGGLTWLRRVAPALGRDDVPNLGYWIYPRVVTEAQDVAGYAAPGLIGEAWANFGPFGVALFGAFGVGLGLAGAVIGRSRGRVEDVATGALIILFLARTHALGLLGASLLIILVLLWRIGSGPWPARALRRGAQMHRTDVPNDGASRVDSADVRADG